MSCGACEQYQLALEHMQQQHQEELDRMNATYEHRVQTLKRKYAYARRLIRKYAGKLSYHANRLTEEC